MTEVVVSAYAASVSKRYDLEVKNEADKAALKFLTDCAMTVQNEKVAKLLESCKVDVDFAHNSRIERKMMCMKAINSLDHVVKFATNENFAISSLKSNLEECLRTLLNFGAAKRNVTLNDFDDCLNASVKIDEARKALIFQRKTQFGAHRRHAEMSMRAFDALKLIVSVNKREYRVNTESKLYKLLEKRFAA